MYSDIYNSIEDDIESKFDATIIAQKRAFYNEEDCRISIENTTEKIIEFCVQLLITLHSFSNSISMMIVMKKNNLEDLIAEIVKADINVIMNAATNTTIDCLI